MNNFVKLIIVFSLAIFSIGCLATEEINWCSKLSEIKKMPFRGEHVDDQVYNALIGMGDDAVPCLVDQLTDREKMADPRKAPPYVGITVGDVALFVLVDMKKVTIKNILPSDVRADFDKKGIYAYFEYVEVKENRQIIQKKLRKKLLGKN